ncbi:MAG: nucleotidyl transferase AbiEii/AbiGii toxin family protein [Caldilineaceae bacterium]|nr:nucleotidyl transferase AbiEii/AbiGii toxin family protein [Caldilineaceae bacterium]MXZ23490.1 nucleotidyl transferase AbiEii/AbiGii toxin family protein [Caldilineaceae bacterium SB0665_bin_21]MYA04295.1 nucleotidyl transferase AbiEii/AbiGii toxin family protein [Caldilineaceae bacterium SB0664_bin_22]MYC62646.1 nucleotidyl transferase AbiEii/AbiGii toxin family protein [Caldilineaceae bacterium SB0661_bin_34]
MSDTLFESLLPVERFEVLEGASMLSGRHAHHLEKDVWVVYALRALWDSPVSASLTFKGGTSLSKVHRAIHRFSEDLDVTYDIRSFASDLVAGSGDEALPPNRSQEKKWTREIRQRLADWTETWALPQLAVKLSEVDSSVRLYAEGDRLNVRYEPLFSGYGFVAPEVTVEFGARSTGEPRAEHTVTCDAAPYLPEVVFPMARPLVMAAERTFWEKATAVHVFCRQQRIRGERLSRHWHDLVRLDAAGVAQKALADRNLAFSVARHKSMFFREKDTVGNWIDYVAAVSGDLQLVPEGAFGKGLAEDYGRMLTDRMLLDEGESFEDLMCRCGELQARANRLAQ